MEVYAYAVILMKFQSCQEKKERQKEMSQRRFWEPNWEPNSARIKIQSPSAKLIEKILQFLEEEFDCVTSPIIPSTQGGFHSFVNIKEDDSQR